jgi:hypothetical protein
MTSAAFGPQLWNRDELYEDVWNQPLTALVSKYSGIRSGHRMVLLVRCTPAPALPARLPALRSLMYNLMYNFVPCLLARLLHRPLHAHVIIGQNRAKTMLSCLPKSLKRNRAYPFQSL